MIKLEKIVKSFPGVKALKGVDLTIREGEVHALVGENGAGKSTLIKILTGVYTKDSGHIYIDDQEVNFHTPLQAQKHGISTIYQELNLIPYLSVAENIYIGREEKKMGVIDWSAINRNAKNLMKDLGLDIDVTRPINTLSTALQQMVAVARAVSVDVKLLVMDEPTSSLDTDEVNVLFNIIKRLKEKNVSIVFISHRLDEVFEICERVTILKDGELVGEYELDKIDQLEMVSMMIGRDATEVLQCTPKALVDGSDKATILNATDIRSGLKLNGVNIKLLAGESIGISGLLGSGRTEFAKVVCGLDQNYRGKIEFSGKEIRMHSPKQALQMGIAYLSEDRKVEGIIPNMSIKENISLAHISEVSKFGIISHKKEDELADKYIKVLRIKTPSSKQKIKNLSGGNQQKVLLARWLTINPKLLILDEPTRGIDVGAKAEIVNIINDLIDNGMSALMISTEMIEIQRTCSKVVVFRDGVSVGELQGNEICDTAIIKTIAQGNKVSNGDSNE